MPAWKRVVVSGSSAHLNHVTASGNISSSFTSTGSFGRLEATSLGGHSPIRIEGSPTFDSVLTASLGVHIPDDANLSIGDGNDLQLYHDGSNSYIKDNGTGNIFYRGGTQTFQNAAGSKTMVVLNAANSVDLNFNSNTKFQTTNTGVSVTGDVVSSGNISGSATSTGSFGTLVVGSQRVDGAIDIHAASNAIQIYDSGNGNNYLNIHNNDIKAPSSVELNLYSNDTLALKLETDQDARFYGKVGIGKSPVSTLDITGTIHASGNISGSSVSSSGDILADGDVVAYNSSDERLKDNIQIIEGSLDKIDGIRGVEFDWNEKSPGWARERGHDVGVIAQEVQKVLPEIVVERKNGYLGVDYKRLVPLLIESVKELKQEVEELKKRV